MMVIFTLPQHALLPLWCLVLAHTMLWDLLLALWCARDSPAGARALGVSVLPTVYVQAPSFVFKLKMNFPVTFKDVRIERVMRRFD